MDDEFGFALLRDRLRDPFGGFSGGVAVEFLPNVGAYNPVVEVGVGDNVNSTGAIESAPRGATTSRGPEMAP